MLRAKKPLAVDPTHDRQVLRNVAIDQDIRPDSRFRVDARGRQHIHDALDNCFADQSSTNVGVIAMADLSHNDDGIAPVIVCCRKNLAGMNEVHDTGVTCINFTSRRAVDIGTNGIARGVREGLHKIRNDARAQAVTRDQDLLNASSGISQVIVEGLPPAGQILRNVSGSLG